MQLQLASGATGLFALLRPRHWAKNALILVPLVFAGRLTDWPALGATLLAVVSFSLVASVVYIVNDIRDVESDRLHPIKSHRPLPSGRVTIPAAATFAVIVLAAAVSIGLASGLSVAGFGLLAIYFGLNLGYSFGLKNFPIIDVAILAFGFIIRVYFGAQASGVEVSQWLYLTVMAFSFFASFGKRRNELIQTGETTRAVNAKYGKDFLDKNMYGALALTVVFYALWTLDRAPGGSWNLQILPWTVPLILLILLSYSLAVERQGASGDPVEIVTHNKPLIGLAGVYIAVVAVALYA